MQTIQKFEGTCRCGTAITGNGTTRQWRHEHQPADKHQASPVGVLKQI